MSKWALIPDGTTPPDVVESPAGCPGWQNVWFIFASDSNGRLHQIGVIYQERVREYGWMLDDVPECPVELVGATMGINHESLAGAVRGVQTLLVAAGVDVRRRGLA